MSVVHGSEVIFCYMHHGLVVGKEGQECISQIALHPILASNFPALSIFSTVHFLFNQVREDTGYQIHHALFLVTLVLGRGFEMTAPAAHARPSFTQHVDSTLAGTPVSRASLRKTYSRH